MRLSMSKKTICFIAILLMGFVLPPKKKIKVYLIGDSTMCEYETKRAPLTGWGMPFRYLFDSTVTIDNRAKGDAVPVLLLARTGGSLLLIVCRKVIMY